MDEDKNQEEFYETMPAAAARAEYSMDSMGMGAKRSISLIAGLALLFAAVGGMWGALQSDGQIMGMFAFNAWTTGLSLVAGVGALYAVLYSHAARGIWTVLASTYIIMAVLGLFVGDGKIIGLFANNYNNVWAYGLLGALFVYLGRLRKMM